MIASLLYASTAAEGLDSADVFKIVEDSSRRNPARDVTGFLIFDGSQFLQYVEGPQEALDGLLDVLNHDRRHHSVRVLHRAESEQRLFPRWAMRRAGATAEQELDTIRTARLPVGMMAEIDRFGTRRRAA
ncbi:BLUF domain-containing protein [Qipengyuania spongiae]|uniref:BLUF domain-containing protein n=1 Tax=Qipengyuania spongiae TaxID=2909673 RepID=A0ABY5T079_9SPHN|nr:BLUF domain-containing protein [Qipengyuania spongiae]UVI39985.1 BLUF domain-containing protein [Qipengyuania spongiae]